MDIPSLLSPANAEDSPRTGFEATGLEEISESDTQDTRPLSDGGEVGYQITSSQANDTAISICGDQGLTKAHRYPAPRKALFKARPFKIRRDTACLHSTSPPKAPRYTRTVPYSQKNLICCGRNYCTLRRLIIHIRRHRDTTRATFWDTQPGSCAYKCGYSSSTTYLRHESLDHYMCLCGFVGIEAAFESHDDSCALTKIDPVEFFSEAVPGGTAVEDETCRVLTRLSPHTLECLSHLGGENLLNLIRRALTRVVCHRVRLPAME